MMRRMIWMGLIASATLLSGCSALGAMFAGDPGVTDREVQKIKPHPARDVTIVKTLDQYGYDDDATYQTRYWYCKQKKNQLQCRPACGKEKMCPDRGSSIRASLAPRASLLKDQPSQASSKPAGDSSGASKADKSGPAGAADEMTDSTNKKPSEGKSGASKSGDSDTSKSKSDDGAEKSGSSKSKEKGGDQ